MKPKAEVYTHIRTIKMTVLQGEDTDRLCGAIVAIAEVFKLTDPTLLFLEVTTLVSKYPDIRYQGSFSVSLLLSFWVFFCFLFKDGQ